MYKERIRDLMNAVKDEPEDLEFIESRVQAFTDYVSYVTWMETRIQRLNIEGIRGQEWRDQVQDLDESRRSRHDVAIGAVRQLNRMCEHEGITLLYDGEIDDLHRTAIGDLIGDIVKEYFDGRTVGKLKQEDLLAADDFSHAVESIPGQTSAMQTMP